MQVLRIGGSNLGNNLAGKTTFNWRCTSTKIPTTALTTSTISVYGLETVQITGAKQSKELPLVIYEDEYHIGHRFFSIWRDLSMSPKTFAHIARKYISIPRGTFLWLLTPINGTFIPTRSFEFYGLQPKTADLSEASNEPGLQTINVDFKFNNFEEL
jgi:hypothetical protein